MDYFSVLSQTLGKKESKKERKEGSDGWMEVLIR